MSITRRGSRAPLGEELDGLEVAALQAVDARTVHDVVLAAIVVPVTMPLVSIKINIKWRETKKEEKSIRRRKGRGERRMKK